MQNTPAIPPPPNNDETTISSIRVKSDPTQLAIEKSRDAMWQNISLGTLFTVAFIARPGFGVETYVLAMLGGYGVINLPLLFGKSRGSIGGITLFVSAGKAFASAIAAAGLRQGPWTAIALALSCVLSSCAGVEQRVADARSDAEETRRVLDQLGAVAAAVCSQPAVKDSDDCRELGHWYDRLKQLEDKAVLP